MGWSMIPKVSDFSDKIMPDIADLRGAIGHLATTIRQRSRR
jgi:hypothetical protein